jgi:hypothetical protein
LLAEEISQRGILCESFLVDDVGERSRNWLRNFAAGSRGHAFSPPVIIDGAVV